MRHSKRCPFLNLLCVLTGPLAGLHFSRAGWAGAEKKTDVVAYSPSTMSYTDSTVSHFVLDGLRCEKTSAVLEVVCLGLVGRRQSWHFVGRH